MNCLGLSADGRIVAASHQVSEQACADWLVANQPPEPVQSMLIVSTPDDAGTGSTQLPSAQDSAAAWGVGFVMVVGCYVIARSVGAVVNFINRD
jgi:hypothetical protein